VVDLFGREIFQGKTDDSAIKRLAESDSDEESDPSKKGKGSQPTNQEMSTSVVKTGSKRPHQVSTIWCTLQLSCASGTEHTTNYTKAFCS